jgi:hypothetical protein
MEDVCIFMNNWSILLTFCISYGHFVYFVVFDIYFFQFWYVVPRKIWQPCRPLAGFAERRTLRSIQRMAIQ